MIKSEDMISVVILTHNSSMSLERTLDSVSFADEVVIIDDFSTDRTVDIAKSHNALVWQRHGDGDFSSQRNFGLEKTKSPWVLFVDSDEIISKDLQEEIRESVSRQGTDGKGIVGFYLKRDDYFLGRKLNHGETHHVRLLRLARKNAGIWMRPIHEYWDVHGPTEVLTHPLVHFSHANVAQFLSKINTYSSINAAYIYKQGKTANALSIIGFPLAKFFRNYIYLLGFLDGTRGIIMALMMSFHSFLTRSKLYLLANKP